MTRVAYNQQHYIYTSWFAILIISQGPCGSMSQVVGLPNNLYKPIAITRLCKLQKKDALYSQPQVIKFTSCLPMVGGSLWILRLLPPLKLVAMILLKVALKHQKSSNHQSYYKSIHFKKHFFQNLTLAYLYLTKFQPRQLAWLIQWQLQH